jgi:class 3 adenylate cyclase/pimeloyl-ACP methyl ester carboxylesterase
VDVGAWLRGLGLERYEQALRDNDVDGEILSKLTADDLKELGVASLGHRKRLLAAIAALEAPSSASDDGSASARAATERPAPAMPAHLARRILASREALEGERKQVTVLFADLKGSLDLIANLDPEVARQILDRALSAMMDGVHRYEGTVNKVLGDGIMALFGAPLAQEDHAVRACYAALALQRAMQAHGPEMRRAHGIELHARVGLHSGEVVVRAIGNDLSMDYDAIGPTVHLASRMEQLASPGTVRLSGATARLVEGFLRLEPLGEVAVKGMARPVAAFALQGVDTSRTRLQAAMAQGLTPLVGRTAEMEVLERARCLVEQGHGQAVVVVGEPGVGKSRLFHEFVRSHRLRDWLVLEASSNSGAEARAWAPVLDLLRHYFGIHEDDDRRRVAEKITGRLLTPDASLRPALPGVLELLGAGSEADGEWSRLGASQRRRRTLDGIRAMLMRESRVQPLVLVLEDMHWADGETRALVDTLVEDLPAARILLLLNARPEYRHAWSGAAAITQLRLEPLGRADLERMLSSLLGDHPSLAELKGLLVERADGNPLFLEECARNLVDSGVLEGARRAYRLTRDVREIEVPPAIAAIIGARIDRLSGERRSLLRVAAVLGEEIPLEVLAAASGMDRDRLHEALAELRARELLDEARLFPDIVYRFRHGLTRRVAYDGMVGPMRARLHRRAGEVLETPLGERNGQAAEVLARHFELGEVPDKAAAHYRRAAEQARRHYSYGPALEFARKASTLAERAGDLEGRALALEQIGDLESLLDRMEPANAAYEAALGIVTDSDAHRRIHNKLHRPAFAIRDGAHIAFYEHGTGEHTLLFVNPIVYGLGMFQPLLEQLSQEFRIITLDPRGTGRSDALRRPFGVADHVEDVRAVIEAAGGPVGAVGISRGSNLVIRLADAYPNLVSHLVLVGAPPDPMGPGSPVQRLDYNDAVVRFLEHDDLEGLTRFLAFRVYSEADAREFAENSIARRLTMPRETLLSFFDPDPSMDVKSLLERVRVPTLVVHGLEDKQVPFAAGEYIAARIPGAKLYPFRGRGHLPLFSATTEFCDVLRQFLQTGEVRSPA